MSSHSDSELGSHTRIKFKAKDKLKLTSNEVKKSLAKTLSVHRCSRREQSLLQLVSLNNVEAVETLLFSGTSANCHDHLKRTPLHMACSRGYTEVVRLLLEYGADPNNQDILLNTPLHLAACNNNLPLIKLLIDAGADLRCHNMNNKNPIQIAETKLRLMRKHLSSNVHEMERIRNEVKEIIELMITMWDHRETSLWGHHRNNIDDLQIIKQSLQQGEDFADDGKEHIDTQMGKLLNELQQFSLT